MVVAEIREEFADDFALFLAEIADVVEFAIVPEIGEDLVGSNHVLVNVVEVGQQQLSPSVKTVERLIEACHLGVGTVKVANQLNGVCNGQFRLAAEELADGEVGG